MGVEVDSELPVIVIAGATASGKSALALALADHLPIEIVSADSAQVYRGMDIGTAKPTPEERIRVVHHLIDCCDPAEAYSAARFSVDAGAAIAAIRGRGRVPLVVGGTMLYLKALIEGLNDLPAQDPALREELSARVRQLGIAALHAQLREVDPVAAERLHPNDWHRIQRALEVHTLTGMPISQLQSAAPSEPSIGPSACFQVDLQDRGVLHRRIESRFHEMMRCGFLEEVEALYRRGDLHAGLPSIRSAGYRQLWSVFSEGVAVSDAVTRGIHATRQLAKRQLTWLRRVPEWPRLQGPVEQQCQGVLQCLAPFVLHLQ